MFLQKAMLMQQSKNLRVPLMNAVRTTAVTTPLQFQARPYFSVYEKIKDRFRTPLKHLETFAEHNHGMS